MPGYTNSQQAYAQSVGTSPTATTWIQSRNPTSNDVDFKIGQFWINSANESLWYLNSFSSTSGYLQANWISVETALVSLSDTANTVVDPSSSSATPPQNIQLTNLDGSMTITSDPSNHRLIFSTNNAGTNWQVVTTNQTLADNNGYFANGGGQLTFTLPATSSVGDTYEICDMGGNGWTIAQNAGQSITILTDTTTLGASGSITSTSKGDWIILTCNVSNLSWFGAMKEGAAIIV